MKLTLGKTGFVTLLMIGMAMGQQYAPNTEIPTDVRDERYGTDDKGNLYQCYWDEQRWWCTDNVERKFPPPPKPAKPSAKKDFKPLEFDSKGLTFSEITSVKMGPLTLMSKDGALLMTCEPSADNKKWDQVGHCTIADGHTFDEVIHATLEQIRLTQDEWTADRHQYRCPKVK